MPGLIEQHLHPILGALCLSVEVISTEDWEPPRPDEQGGRQPRGILQARLRQADSRLTRPEARSSSPGATTRSGTVRSHAGRSTPSAPPGRSSSGTARRTSSPELPCARGARASRRLRSPTRTRRTTSTTWEKGHFYEKGLELITGPCSPGWPRRGACARAWRCW